MTASTVLSLGEALQDLLAAAVTALEATDRGAPGLQYISPGLPVESFSCDQVAVYVSTITEEMTQPIAPIPATGRRYARGRVNLPAFNIRVSRCLSNQEGGDANYRPPTAAQISVDGLDHAEDGWALWNGITAAIRAGTLFGGRCDDIHFDGMVPLDPQGGVAGWTLTLRGNLPGIPA